MNRYLVNEVDGVENRWKAQFNFCGDLNNRLKNIVYLEDFIGLPCCLFNCFDFGLIILTFFQHKSVNR